jgi:hypothetical protein
LELNAGGVRLDLHWPLAHTRELAGLLWELVVANSRRGGLRAQREAVYHLGQQRVDAPAQVARAQHQPDGLKVLVYDGAGM